VTRMGANRFPGLPLRAMRGLLVTALLAAVALTFASAGSAASPDDGLPDIWSGSWEAALMPDEVPLGTLTWRPVSYAEGAAYVGRSFGGKTFEGCPADGRTRFFRGKYHVGGDLIACTVGADAKTIVGRFNGNDILRSGSFSVTMVEFGDEAEFLGQYFEDDGLTVDWCGDFKVGTIPLPATDTAAPMLELGRATRTGRVATVRLRAYDQTAAVRTEVQLRRSGKTVARATLTLRGDGTLKLTRLRVPGPLRGAFTVAVRARDAAGNATAWTSARLRT
jgi:hypothetical protein